jgi:hypothetical protein
MEYIADPKMSICCLLFGSLGISGCLKQKYLLEISFAVFNLLIFALIALTYLQYYPRSMSSINYFVQMLGSIWLVFRIQHNNAKTKRLKEYLA